MLQGIGVSAGIAFEKAVVYRQNQIVIPSFAPESAREERAAFKHAVDKVKRANLKLAEEAGQKAGSSERAIFEAHIDFLEDDDSIIDPINALIDDGKNAAEAVALHFDRLIERMRQVTDEYLRSRASDFQDIRQQLLRAILHIDKVDLSHLERDAIIVAQELTPADTIRMDMAHIKGFVCEKGGATSHTAIIARAVGIPAVVGCAGLLTVVQENSVLLLDGATGEVILSPSVPEVAEFQRRKVVLEEERRLLEEYRDQPSMSADGVRVRICANIGSSTECKAAIENGCEGIGLFRSEFLYMAENGLPSEETQTVAYRTALAEAHGLSVTIRTLDAGGDKGILSLAIPKEENPFLGYRAIRVSLGQPGLFKTQLRALYRASTAGSLRIMFPMICGMEELLTAKRVVDEVKHELEAEGIPYADDVKLGMMIEVPSAALMANELAKEVDFFSIGTNDLTQYTLAVDRGNDKIAKLYTHTHPAVVRLIHQTIQAAHQNGIPCCMCGEAAGDPAFVPLLLGMGLDDFSMSSTKVLGVRQLIAKLSVAHCQEAAAQALRAATSQEIQTLGKELCRQAKE